MDMDATEMASGLMVPWQPHLVQPLDWRANKFSISSNLSFLGSKVKGTAVNIYGSSAFPQKRYFLHFLCWLAKQATTGSWIVRGNFNLIASLNEKKGGRMVMDRHQEAFGELMARNPFIDVENDNVWHTWNNKHGGSHLVASRIDSFLTTEDIS